MVLSRKRPLLGRDEEEERRSMAGITDGKRLRFNVTWCAKCWRPQKPGERFWSGSAAVNCALYCADCWDDFSSFFGALEDALTEDTESEPNHPCRSCSGVALPGRGVEGFVEEGVCCNRCPYDHGPLCPNIRCGACFRLNAACPFRPDGSLVFYAGSWQVGYAYYCSSCWDLFYERADRKALSMMDDGEHIPTTDISDA